MMIWNGNQRRYIASKRRARRLTRKRRIYSRRFIIGLFLFFLVSGGLVYFLIFSPVFRIKNVVIEGNNPILKKEYKGYFESLVLDKNFFLISKKALSEEIKKDYRIQDFYIKKVFPHTLKIFFQQSHPFAKIYFRGGEESLVYCVRQKVYVIDFSLLNRKNFATLPADIPIIYDKTDISTESPEWQSLFISLAKIISFYSLSNSQSSKDFWIDFLEIKKQGGKITLEITTGEGWKIFASSSDLEGQFQRLNIILEKQIKDRKNLSYIDLRYGDMIFYK